MADIPRAGPGTGTASPRPQRAPLVDGHGRSIGDVRISVTDRCNFRCRYCMPAQGLPWLERTDLLSYDEMARVVGVLAQMGVRDVRLTGGEPLLRKELHKLVRQIAPCVEDLSLTTNGVLLPAQLGDLVAAGLRRVNISIDSLDPDKFEQITRRRELDRVMAGITAAIDCPELSPVRLNVVAIRGFTEAEILAFAELARDRPVEVRFIEFMPLDADHRWEPTDVLTGEEVRRTIEARFPLVAVERSDHATADRWRFADGTGSVGFINPVSSPFCHDCNRIRITAEGMLRTCLFSVRETDLREPLRSGASDDELDEAIRTAVWRKELKHRINEPGFAQPPRTMSRIGG